MRCDAKDIDIQGADTSTAPIVKPLVINLNEDYSDEDSDENDSPNRQ